MSENHSNVWTSTVSTLESRDPESIVSAERATPALSGPGLSVQAPTVIDTEVDELVRAFFSGKSQRTIESYSRDLQTFCQFEGVSTISEAVKVLFSGTHREANLCGLKYRQHLVDIKKLKPTSINRHLSSLRSLVALGRSLGMIPWNLAIKNQKVTELRNLSALDPSGIKRLIEAAGLRGNKTAKRDVALCTLLYTAGLRRSEAVSITYPDDVALERNAVWVLGKGRTEKQELILPEKTLAALEEWLGVRGNEPGPLFINFDRAGKGDGRLTGRSVHRVIRSLGKKIGHNDLHPHALRRGAITSLLKKAKGIFDVEQCLDFSRHADVSTMMIYRKRNDSRENQAATSRMLEADL